MSHISSRITTLCFFLALTRLLLAREWQDGSGNYRVMADLLARNDTMVVLEKENKDLIAVQISELSEKDQAFIEEKFQAEDDAGMQTWTTTEGLELNAAAVDYARREVVIQRRRGRPYVNDKRFSNLPGVYRKMVPLIVNHFEGTELENEADFKRWVKSLRGVAKSYTCEGVLLEFENGDLYAIPFFFLTDADRKVLEPGWKNWVAAADDEEYRQQQALSLQAETMANRDRTDDRRQVAMLSLHLQGYQAGLFDLWEVGLYPPANVYGMPMSVVVPGRNSQQATAAAIAQYPGYRVGAVVKVRRRY